MSGIAPAGNAGAASTTVNTLPDAERDLAKPTRTTSRAWTVVKYFALCVLTAQVARGLFWRPGPSSEVMFCGLFGALIGLTRARYVLWWAAGAVALSLVGVAYTPVVPWIAHGLQRSDPITRAPAVVVLGSYLHKDGTLSSPAKDRILHAYEILGQGYAPRLVLTAGNPEGSWDPIIRAQMSKMGLSHPIDVVGPVADTHDEALAVAKLARERGWDRVILVTHPWHMRRAAGAFEKAGVRVICSPCPDGGVNVTTLDSPAERAAVFRLLLHERIGYWVYHSRGWL